MPPGNVILGRPLVPYGTAAIATSEFVHRHSCSICSQCLSTALNTSDSFGFPSNESSFGPPSSETTVVCELAFLFSGHGPTRARASSDFGLEAAETWSWCPVQGIISVVSVEDLKEQREGGAIGCCSSFEVVARVMALLAILLMCLGHTSSGVDDFAINVQE